MKDKLDFYINGSWVESESTEKIEVINPANEELIGHITAGTKEDINNAVKAAFEAFVIHINLQFFFRIHLHTMMSMQSIANLLKSVNLMYYLR